MDQKSLDSWSLPLRRHDLLFFEGTVIQEIENPYFERLPFFAIPTNKHSQLREIASRQFKDFPLDRIRLLQGIDWAITQAADVINISMGIDQNSNTAIEPLAEAIRIAIREHNTCVTVAAGNAGPKTGTLQALAYLDGVVTVGGATPDGILLENSSRGNVGTFGPTCIADGSLAFSDNRFVPCSSFACARVSKYAGIIAKLTNLVLSTVRLIIEPSSRCSANANPGPPRIAFLDTGAPEQLPPRSTAFQDLMQRTEGKLPIECNPECMILLVRLINDNQASVPSHSTPKIVLKVIQTLCINLEGRPEYEVGAGFLEISYIHDYFANLNAFQLLKTFCDVKTKEENGFPASTNTAPLFTRSCFQDFWIRYVDGMELIAAKVRH